MWKQMYNTIVEHVSENVQPSKLVQWFWAWGSRIIGLGVAKNNR